ncbi:hypothetical protein HYU95_01015 [Candidatus Daviesbacteria bacterium]|nr:hypothetical protein [Candidatus Daviesbacteria bacterium]
MNNKGIAPIFIILLIAASLTGYLIYQQQSKQYQPASQPTTKTQESAQQTSQPSPSISPRPKQSISLKTNPTPQLSPTSRPSASDDLGFKLDFISNPNGTDGVDILVEADRSMKVFTIQATRDESYILVGNPIESAAGIEWSTTGGNLAKGGSQEISVKVNSEVYSKEYSGTGIIQNSRGVQKKFPIKIAVYNPIKGTGDTKIVTSISGTPFIKIIYPNGGETFIAGSGINIKWDTNSPGNCSVYAKDSSNSINKISNEVAYASWKSIFWTTRIDAALSEDKMKISITCTDSQGRTFEDDSDNSFTVKK